MKDRPFHFSLLFISAALLSFEISLMRILKVEGFGNFTYGAIALALTGFGASGTFISLLGNRIRGREMLLCSWSPALFCLFLGLGFYCSMLVEFDALRILWDRNQILRLLFRYLLYTLPFIVGSAFVVISFMVGSPGRVYFFNLTGSGFGIFAILGCLYFIPPSRILIVPLLLGLTGSVFAVLSLPETPAGRSHIRRIAALAPVIPGFLLFYLGDISVLPFKGRELALNLPDARVLCRHVDPFGTLEVIGSEKLRIAPGLSYAFEGELPRQHGLYIDGDLLSAIDAVGDDASSDYLVYQTQSAAYQLHDRPEVFIVGLRGGAPVLRALRNGSVGVTVSEENPNLPVLLTGPFAEFTGRRFTDDRVSIAMGGGRSLLHASAGGWDIVDIAENPIASSIGGIYSADTDYNLTTGAFEDYLKALGGGGTVSATVPLKQPPRNLPRLVATGMAAVRRISENPERCIVVIRSWSSGTMLLRTEPFSRRDIDRVRGFCERMRFDLVYYYGMEEDEANRFNIVEDSIYHRTILPMIRGDRRFTRSYVFSVDPATDDRPYFSYFFRVSRLGHLFAQTGRQWLFVVEGGYIVLFATFAATLLLAAVFILLPPLCARRYWKRGRLPVLLYFSMIAIGFMFIEILLMQKFRRHIANPLYSNSMIIAALLISTGIASFFSDRIEQGRRKKRLFHALLGLSLYLLLLMAALEFLFPVMTPVPRIMPLLLPILTMIPLGLCMGLFFPLGMSALKVGDAAALPWAWSVNGFFSVLASTGTVLVASNAGLLATALAALLCYWMALLFFPSA